MSTDGDAGGREPPWTKVGYALTAGWFLLVLAVTDADPGHPFFDTIFSVPLAAWLGALVVSHIVRRRR